MLSLKRNLEETIHKLSLNLSVIGVYCLPDSWKSISLISQDLKNLNVNFYTAFIVPTNSLVFKNSCHICQINYKSVYVYKYYLSLSIPNDEVSGVINKLNACYPEIKTLSICQVNLRKDLICPLMSEQQKERVEIVEKLVDVVENYFSDEEIHKNKDILVSMNSNGWVPLTVIENKLCELIIVNTREIVEKLRNSQTLQLDTTEKYVRRKQATLPVTAEHRQVVVLDIPDTIKSMRQLPTYLQLDGDSGVEYFDYSIHSAIVTLQSRQDAIRLVDEVQISGKMKAKLLVPSIVADDSSNVILSLSDVMDVDKVLASLALKHEPAEQIHVMRLAPEELIYTFKEGFLPPTQSMIDSIVKQCNFYFSDANVLKDLFILKKLKSNPGGWISLATVARFKQLVKLSNDDIDNVVYAMCYSDQVQISRDASSLRRRLPIPDWDPSIYIRSLFLWNLPRICDSYEKLDQVFREEGRFVVNVSRYIRADRNVPADLRKLVDKIPALGKYNCGVIEFNSREAMLSAGEFIHLKWAAVKTFYLDAKEELPKPAVIVGKSSKSLPPPIPVSTFADNRVAALQAGTRIDPRFWQVARLLSAKKRNEMKIYTNDCDNGGVSRREIDTKLSKFNINNIREFPALGGSSSGTANKVSGSGTVNRGNGRGTATRGSGTANRNKSGRKMSPLKPINTNTEIDRSATAANEEEIGMRNRAAKSDSKGKKWRYRKNRSKSKPLAATNTENEGAVAAAVIG